MCAFSCLIVAPYSDRKQRNANAKWHYYIKGYDCNKLTTYAIKYNCCHTDE